MNGYRDPLPWPGADKQDWYKEVLKKKKKCNNWRRSFKEEWKEKEGEGQEDHTYKAWRCEHSEDKSGIRLA